MNRQLSEEDLSVENEVLIRSGKKEDLDFFLSSEESTDWGHHILLQIIRWWNEYGFRCLYAGYLEEKSKPFCLNYWIDDSDNHRFKSMKYGGLYQPLTVDVAHGEGAYVRKDFRRQDLWFKFCQQRNKLLYQRGKRLLRAHMVVKGKMPALKNAINLGYVPDHWISRVRINLSLLRSDVFVHHSIKESDLKRFPLTLFDMQNG